MIIDGKAIASRIKDNIRKKVAKMDFKPGLAVVLVGNDPASQIYVNSKEKSCQEAGFYSRKIVLPSNAGQKRLIDQILKLNKDPKIHGILVQLPLPKGYDEDQAIKAISPEKDVDCFHPANVGKLALIKRIENLDQFLVPCTAKGMIRLIESTGKEISGKKAVIIGRSNLSGKPSALLLLAKDATVTICHSGTPNLAEETEKADILVAAVGRPNLIKASMVKKGAVVIDVGTNRTEKGLVGDVDFEEVKKKAGFITPVPGGVGPMTIACLLENTLLLAKKKLDKTFGAC